MKHKKLRISLAVIVGILLLAVIGCGIYVSDYYAADETALGAMASGEAVTVELLEAGAAFIPQEPEVGFIFYPGGKVEYRAYAPLMQALAEENILCVLVEMPCNLAVLDVDAAEDIPELYPEITTWYIGGHSLGGSMAASYASEHEDAFAGVALLASYSTASLEGLKVVSLYGSEDGVLNMEKYQQYSGNLPEDTREYIISGGCHAWFGSYGPQAGDGEPAISPEEQRKITVDFLTGFLTGE